MVGERTAWRARGLLCSIDEPHRRKALADLLAIDPGERFHELLSGELVRKANPSGEHGDAQAGIVGELRGPFQRGRGGPGGWWIFTEVEVELSPHDVVRPDVLGWRRARVPQRPTGFPIRTRPAWVCEVHSESNPAGDRVRKLNVYHRFEVPRRGA